MARMVRRVAHLMRNPEERRNTIRFRLFQVAGRFTELLVVEGPDVRYIVRTRDQAGVGMLTFVRAGAGEAQLLGRLERVLSDHTSVHLDGATVLEIGANIGTETVWMTVHHGVRHVIAVEPDADNLRLLRANVALNGVDDRVQVVAGAVSDVSGTVTFERSPDNEGDHRVRVDQPSTSARMSEVTRETVTVPSRTLAALAAEGTVAMNEVDLIWMDVQGHEAHVLAGADNAAIGIPVVTEYWPYGLRRAGALERFHAIVQERYAAFVDLGDAASAGRAQPTAQIAAAMSGYHARAAVTPSSAATNLLLIPR